MPAHQILELAIGALDSLGVEIAVEQEPNLELPTYCDPNQIGDCVAAMVRQITECGATSVRIGANGTLEGQIILSIGGNGFGTPMAGLAGQLDELPPVELWGDEPQLARGILRMNLIKRTIEDNLGRLEVVSDKANANISMELPAPTAAAIFARMFDRLMASPGPVARVALLQVRADCDRQGAAEYFQSLLQPGEVAFPISTSNWLVATAAEAEEIDGRMQAIERGWERESPSPLTVRAVGHWPLNGKRDEILGQIQTLVDLGDLSIETHPKLLLVRPSSSRPGTLDRQLHAAGYDVTLAAEEDGLSEAMRACRPDAVVVAGASPSHVGASRLKASTKAERAALANVPVVLMSATARTIQQSLQQAAHHAAGDEEARPPASGCSDEPAVMDSPSPSAPIGV